MFREKAEYELKKEQVRQAMHTVHRAGASGHTTSRGQAERGGCEEWRGRRNRRGQLEGAREPGGELHRADEDARDSGGELLIFVLSAICVVWSNNLLVTICLKTSTYNLDNKFVL